MDRYHLHQKGEACWVTFPQLEQYPELSHLFTTRRGGVSKGPRESWNFGKCPEEPAEHILQNRDRLCMYKPFLRRREYRKER